MDLNKAFDELKNNINNRIDIYEQRNRTLQEENAALKDEHYKDNEIKRLKQENDELREALLRGFEISKTEDEKLKAWQKKHIEEKHGGNGRCGAIGGRFSYEFIPTGIGTFGTCKCICGEKFDFQEP